MVRPYRENDPDLGRPEAAGRRRHRGFTTVEMALSLAILGVLVASLLSITVETSSFIGESDTDVTVQTEGNRAFLRLLDLLRKSGRLEDGGITYPRVTNGGAELEFRLLADADGNGYAFDQASANLEWSPKVFTVRTDASGNLGVYDGAARVYHLGRYIQNLQFRTVAEDSALALKEIRVTFEARKPTPRGYDKVHAVSGSIHMRN